MKNLHSRMSKLSSQRMYRPGSTSERWLCSAWVPGHVPSAFCSLVLHTKCKEIVSAYVPERLTRQCHVSTRINVQLIRTRIATPLCRRRICLAEIRGAGRCTRIDDLNRDSVSYATDRISNAAGVRHGIAGATVALRAGRSRPACDWALAVTKSKIHATGA